MYQIDINEYTTFKDLKVHVDFVSQETVQNLVVAYDPKFATLAKRVEKYVMSLGFQRVGDWNNGIETLVEYI